MLMWMPVGMWWRSELKIHSWTVQTKLYNTTHVQLYTYICCKYKYMHIYIYTYMHIYIYIYLCVYTYIYIVLYIIWLCIYFRCSAHEALAKFPEQQIKLFHGNISLPGKKSGEYSDLLEDFFACKGLLTAEAFLIFIPWLCNHCNSWNIFWFIVLGSKPGVAIKRFGQLSNGPRSCPTHGIHASIPCSLVTHRPCDSEPVWGYVRTAGTRRRFDRYEFTWHHSTNVGPRRSSSAYHCSSQGSSPSNNSATPEELAHLLASPLESARIWL